MEPNVSELQTTLFDNLPPPGSTLPECSEHWRKHYADAKLNTVVGTHAMWVGAVLNTLLLTETDKLISADTNKNEGVFIVRSPMSNQTFIRYGSDLWASALITTNRRATDRENHSQMLGDAPPKDWPKIEGKNNLSSMVLCFSVVGSSEMTVQEGEHSDAYLHKKDRHAGTIKPDGSPLHNGFYDDIVWAGVQQMLQESGLFENDTSDQEVQELKAIWEEFKKSYSYITKNRGPGYYRLLMFWQSRKT